MTKDFTEAILSISRLRILVAGDMMLDHYISGTTDRTSPEAPVPVVLVNSEHSIPGGAANVARNVAAAGAWVQACGVTGDDAPGHKLRHGLTGAGVDTSALLMSPQCETVVKTRIVSQGQQIVRLDYEKSGCMENATIEAVADILKTSLESINAVIISDYAKGFVVTPVLENIITICATRNIPVFVDPKGRDYARYRGVFAITPNSREAQEATGISTATDAGLRQAAERIKSITESQLVIITRGADGLALLDQANNWILLPTSARETFDVTGAGDTFVAWLTMGIAAGLTADEAAKLGNLAAGVAVGRRGPAVVSPLDVRRALAPGRLGQKLISEDDLEELGDELRRRGKKIVLTNGCFDFLHAGHVAFLQQAKALGDILVLATNTDVSIQRLKGTGRPIIRQKQREELLASIEAVDYVTAFRADTPHETIARLKPDILVKGGNYLLDEVEGADLQREQGGEVITLPIVHDISTSKLVRGLE